MSTILTQGIILKRDHYNDFDRQLIIYTQELGKVLAIIKGAKRITSKLNSHLDYYYISDLMLADGARFKHIAGAKINQKYNDITGNLSKQLFASYFLEVVDRLVKFNFVDKYVFEIIKKFFNELSREKDKKELIVLNKYLFDLLSHLGYCLIVRSKTQRELINQLNKLVVEVCEREILSFKYIVKMSNMQACKEIDSSV
ncbi:MAG TPA: DNA repair protein RecO [Patescibacteria group bacterium]|nr:DNA repair protein RecO [Patescibacteria group bacterium]